MWSALGLGGGAEKEQPTKSEMKSVKLEQKFENLPVKETFDLMFSKELIVGYQESQGNKDVEVSDWKEVTTEEDKAASVTKWERTLKYTVPMNVPLPKMMADSMGMVDTIAVTTETAILKDGVYTVTATCELTGPPMCNKVDIKPTFTVRGAPEDPAVGLVVIDIQFSFNVWGLASMVESTMESGVQKGFSDLLATAVKMASEKKA